MIGTCETSAVARVVGPTQFHHCCVQQPAVVNHPPPAAALKALPGVPQVAAFDTAYHANILEPSSAMHDDQGRCTSVPTPPQPLRPSRLSSTATRARPAAHRKSLDIDFNKNSGEPPVHSRLGVLRSQHQAVGSLPRSYKFTSRANVSVDEVACRLSLPWENGVLAPRP
jgi:hypothetical protein